MTKKICKAYAWAIARCHTGNLKESQVKIGGLHSKRVILNLLCKKLIPYLIVWMANKSVVREYFSLLEKTLDRLNIKDINSWAYLQLRWMSLDPKKEKGKKRTTGWYEGPYQHCYINAAGQYLPPMIIYDRGIHQEYIPSTKMLYMQNHQNAWLHGFRVICAMV